MIIIAINYNEVRYHGLYNTSQCHLLHNYLIYLQVQAASQENPATLRYTITAMYISIRALIGMWLKVAVLHGEAI